MCDRKIVGLVKSWQVYNALPLATFTLEHLAVVDPRLESLEPAQVYALTMTKDEFDKLVNDAWVKRGLKVEAE